MYAIFPNLSNYADVIDKVVEYADLVSPVWELVRNNAEGNSSSIVTTAGIESTSNKWVALRTKSSINNSGTEDVKYTYVILQHDSSLQRLIVRTASYVTSGSSFAATPFADAVIIDLSALPYTIGVLFTQDSFALQVIDTIGNTRFAAVLALSSVLPSGADRDNCFCVTGNVSDCWVLPTSAYSASLLDLISPLNSDTINSQQGSIVMAPLAVSDNILKNKFVGYAKNAFKTSINTIAAFDFITYSADTYRVFNNSLDGVNFMLIKEN